MKLLKDIIEKEKIAGMYSPLTDDEIEAQNEVLERRGGLLRRTNGVYQIVADGDKTLKQSKKKIKEDVSNKITADKLEMGDEVEITGDVSFKGEEGKITNFGKDKKFVVVKLHDGGEHSFHSSDVSKTEHDYNEPEAQSSNKKDESNKFYVAFYDNDEERSWIGLVSKEHGGKWHEHPYKGKPENRWGQSYAAYFSADDIMRWIHKDYARSIEIDGPFYNSKEAENHVIQNWGTLSESIISEDNELKTHKLYNVKTGEEVKIGEFVRNKGKSYRILGWQIGSHPGKNDIIETNRGQIVPEEIDLEIVPNIKPYNRKVEENVWEKLTYAANIFGCKDFSKLPISKASELIDFSMANKAVSEMSCFGENVSKRFWTLSNESMKIVIEEHPEVVLNEALLTILNETLQQTPWDILSTLAKRHNEIYFSRLPPDTMSKYINYKRACDLAYVGFEKKNFEDLKWKDMMNIMNSNPNLLQNEAKSMYSGTLKETALKLIPINLDLIPPELLV